MLESKSQVTRIVLPGTSAFYRRLSLAYAIFDYASQVISSQKQWTVPVDQEKITCMKLFRGNPMAVVPGPYSYNPNTPYIWDMESKLIFIATYNESTGEGFVYRCHIDPTTGVIDRSTEVKYKGFGKVKAMAHKAPNINKG